MTVSYLGHCAFLFEESSGERLLIDPFGNDADHDWFLAPFPALTVDLVAVTHDHFDHNATGALPDGTPVMAGEGQRTVGGTTITGVRDLHAGKSGLAGMENTIYVVEHEGVRFCHLGDNRPDLPDEAIALLGKVDALFLPVDDSERLMTLDEANALVERISPMIVIPMRYYIEGLTTAGSTLGGPDRWYRRQPRRRPLRRATMRVDRRGLPYEREAWLVKPELSI